MQSLHFKIMKIVIESTHLPLNKMLLQELGQQCMSVPIKCTGNLLNRNTKPRIITKTNYLNFCCFKYVTNLLCGSANIPLGNAISHKFKLFRNRHPNCVTKRLTSQVICISHN